MPPIHPDDGALARLAEDPELQAHVAACESCRNRVAQLQPELKSPGIADTALAKTAISPPRAASSAFKLGRGDLVGRFQVIAPLGEGGMGQVYAAFDPELGRKLAIKILRNDLAGSEHASEHRQRLLREAQAMARLSSAHVVQVYDVGVLDSQVFVAMEYVEGETLAAWLAQPRTATEILAKFMDAGRGLADAHAAGLIHRDFKPENVLVDRSGIAKVTDFGLARPTEARPDATSAPLGSALAAQLTLHGTLMGTPAYMSPEQFEGKPTDARSDQFSFCVALYEALYGERPFAGDTFDTVRGEVLAGRIRAAPPRSKVKAKWRAILLRGLANAPAERHPSMEVLLRKLGRRSRTRRNIGIAVRILIAIGLVAATRYASRVEPCQIGPEELGDAWNASRANALAHAFAGTDPEVWQIARSGLEKYASDWLAQRKDACLDTRVQGSQSEAAMQLRMNCLDRSRSALGALADALATADAKALAHAPDAIANLPRLEACADVSRLNAEGEAESPDQYAAREPLRKRIDAARAQFELGNLQRARKLVDAVLVDAKGLPSVSAEAGYVAGMVSLYEGDAARAEGEFRRSVQDAIATHSDTVAAESGALFIYSVADVAKKVETAKPFVEGLVERAGDPHADARYHYALAEAARVAGEARQAANEFEQVARTVGPDTMTGARARLMEALALVQTHEAPRALDLAKDALAALERLQGRENPLIATDMLTVANHYVRRGRFEQAAALISRAKASLARQGLPMDDVLEMSALVDAGEGRPELAKKELEQAIASTRSPSRRNSMILNLARLEIAQDELDDAERLSREVLASLPVGAADRAAPLTLLGEIALAHEKRDEAEHDLEEAMKCRLAGDDPPSEGARTRFALARLTGDRKLALEARALDHSMLEHSRLQDAIDAWLAAHR